MSDITLLFIASIISMTLWSVLSTGYGVMQHMRATRAEKTLESMTKEVYTLLSTVSTRLRDSPVQHRELQEQHRDILARVDSTRLELANMLMRFHGEPNSGINIQTGGQQSNAGRDNVGRDRHSRDDAAGDINNGMR